MEQDPAPALGRGLRLLQQLGQSGAMSLERLSAECDIPKSSCVRLLRSLQLAGMVHRDPVSKRYLAVQRLVPVQLGPAAFQQRLRDEMLAIVEAWGCTAEFWQPRDRGIALVERCEPESAEVRILARIGFPRDLEELEAVARSWLAWQPIRSRRYWRWNGDDLQEALTPEQVRSLLEQVRTRGWTVDEQPNKNRVRRLAAPIRTEAVFIGVLAVAALHLPSEPARLAADLQAASTRLATLYQEG
ncbi:MAG: helix-turn-helix domain-containing protein [Planctomycetota bacterium]